MKSLGEIKEMLASELNQCIPIVKNIAKPVEYFNEYLGDTSFLLVGLLDAHLREDDEEWTSLKWMDDSLITDVNLTDRRLSIWGIAIWGIEDDTEQWTEPFFFEVALDDFTVDMTHYSFLFGEIGQPEISYEHLRKNPDIWAGNDPDWRYIVHVKPEKII